VRDLLTIPCGVNRPHRNAGPPLRRLALPDGLSSGDHALSIEGGGVYQVRSRRCLGLLSERRRPSWPPHRRRRPAAAVADPSVALATGWAFKGGPDWADTQPSLATHVRPLSRPFPTFGQRTLSTLCCPSFWKLNGDTVLRTRQCRHRRQDPDERKGDAHHGHSLRHELMNVQTLARFVVMGLTLTLNRTG
jgi:hypothetical protein